MEPDKIYYVCDLGVELEATWSVVHANHDFAVFDGHRRAVKDGRSECYNDHSAN